MHDFSSLVIWWGVLFGIGLIFLPLTIRIFPSFFDKGYAFAKILGTLFISYLVFVLGLSKILPFSQGTILVVAFTSLAINLAIIFKRKLRLQRSFVLVLFFEELLFFIALCFWSYIRATQPNIQGLEKFMDFGFINAILRSENFPPPDMWFTPLRINYYYFGHLMTAVLTKFSGIPSNVTFNLMVATIFAMTVSACFTIGANLMYSISRKKTQNIKQGRFQISDFRFRIFISGLLCAFLVAGAGNLHTIYTFFTPYQNENPVAPTQLKFSPQTFPNSYWYPNATRFIPFTIHEFPMYSYVVSDLHGHVLDIPFVLLTLGFLLSIFFSKPTLPRVVLLSLFLAVMYMTNAWDGIIYFLLSALVLLFLTIRPINSQNEELKDYNVKLTVLQHEIRFYILRFIFYVLLLLGGFILFSLPFSLYFKPFVSGIGIVCAPAFLTKLQHIGPLLFEANHCQRSPLWQLAILYGFFYFWVVLFITLFIKRVSQHKKNHTPAVLKFGFLSFIGNWKLEIENLRRSDIFVFLLITLSTILILIPEIIYVKDIYPAHYRANTMFKLVYQAFIMLSLASGYSIMRIITNFKFPHFVQPLSRLWPASRTQRGKQISNFKFSLLQLIVLIIGSIGLLLVGMYPTFAVASYYDNVKTYKGLDGTTYLAKLYPTDYQAIIWINNNIKGQPVILEAQGDSYTDYARISANTGLPTVLGWTVHEWLWRGTYDIPAPRISEIQNLYESKDLRLINQLIQKYNIEYVFIGDLERQKYPNIHEDSFKELGNAVYHNGTTTIYKLREN